MFRTTRMTALTASTALVFAGLSAATGIATADGGCEVRSYQTKKDVSTVGITHTYEKIASAESIGIGTTVTYDVKIGTTGIGNPYVNTITDFPPAGFGAPVKVAVTAYHAGRGQQTEDVTATPNAGGWKVTSTGWFVNSGNPVTLHITYPVPDDLRAGQQITSGGVGVAGTVGVSNEMPNLTACFTARGANPGETVLGSLDDNGLGSNDGQLSSTGSFSDVLAETLRKFLGS
ncbi:hypothetical protein FOH10_23545 [Nocardia otitidiscaviarum]|uniref:Uncharacterized protein n=2 Tax=Nocardia otitidiscaviarum TaxID=1823 RepID=A0A516NQR0_9NOCA|nr:hypothetical protein [Nocardia otitidiscaviarum]QDP81247.1 hypothetical protein FOH10_23545 [Nocardia otitidiscaviarum]